MIDPAGPPHVVIVGGGFGGLFAALHLARRPVRVTLVDRRNHHLFQPLLYQVATAALSPAHIARPLRSILRRAANLKVIMAEVEAVDLAGRRVLLDGGEVAFDAAILATGARPCYSGHDDWESLAPGLKSLEDALEIRRRILLAFEAAERETDSAERRARLTFVIVGGGPAGVEMAGALAEIVRHAIPRDFRLVDPAQARVVLLERGPRLLPSFPEPLSKSVEHALRRRGVEVRTGAGVTGVTPDGVWIGAEQIPSRAVLWAAGVTPSPLARSLDVPLDEAGRVLVEPDLSVPGHPETFVVGDLCAFVHQTGAPLPGLAPVAVQQGRAAAENAWRRLAGEPVAPFRYSDKGSMATIGRATAVAVMGDLQLSGRVAWLAWLLRHIWFLIGFGNRLLVLAEWAWAYVTWQRGARILTGPWRRRP